MYGTTLVSSSQYLQIGDSSDDPDINDVLYAGSGFPGIFVSYNGPTPSSPFPLIIQSPIITRATSEFPMRTQDPLLAIFPLLPRTPVLYLFHSR
ncbi:hypothetical protein PGH42_15060 [Legionella pneumophila]|nr:hypothetical protein PGH42_15060 [Legionella pneumophila]